MVVVAILVVLLLVVLPKGGLIGSSKSEFNIKFDTDGSTLYGDMIIKMEKKLMFLVILLLKKAICLVVGILTLNLRML